MRAGAGVCALTQLLLIDEILKHVLFDKKLAKAAAPRTTAIYLTRRHPAPAGMFSTADRLICMPIDAAQRQYFGPIA
jgi:hypothetical protein